MPDTPGDAHDAAADQTDPTAADAVEMDDIKAKMRAALDRKNSRAKGVQTDGPLREKAHGSEVAGGGPKMHRRRAGGGGA